MKVIKYLLNLYWNITKSLMPIYAILGCITFLPYIDSNILKWFILIQAITYSVYSIINSMSILDNRKEDKRK